MSCGVSKAYLDNTVIFERLEGESDQLYLPSGKTRRRDIRHELLPDARPSGARCSRVS